MTETTKRIIYLKEKMNLNDHQLEVAAGLKPSFLQAWKNGKKNSKGEIIEVNPSNDSICKLARYFNVSADYLLCLTDEPKPLESREVKQVSSSVPAIFGQIPDLFKEQRFIETAKIYNELPNKYREEVYALIRGIAIGCGLNVQEIIRR